jgi:hypothetical protein
MEIGQAPSLIATKPSEKRPALANFGGITTLLVLSMKAK